MVCHFFAKYSLSSRETETSEEILRLFGQFSLRMQTWLPVDQSLMVVASLGVR